MMLTALDSELAASSTAFASGSASENENGMLQNKVNVSLFVIIIDIIQRRRKRIKSEGAKNGARKARAAKI